MTYELHCSPFMRDGDEANLSCGGVATDAACCDGNGDDDDDDDDNDDCD